METVWENEKFYGNNHFVQTLTNNFSIKQLDYELDISILQ